MERKNKLFSGKDASIRASQTFEEAWIVYTHSTDKDAVEMARRFIEHELHQISHHLNGLKGIPLLLETARLDAIYTGTLHLEQMPRVRGEG
jgi:hypothetical protein